MEECFFCGKQSCNELELSKFANLKVQMPASKRPLQSVLQHLATCIRTELVFSMEAETLVCSKCLNELTEYDYLMVKLLASQKKLTNQLNSVLTRKCQRKPESVAYNEANTCETTAVNDITSAPKNELEDIEEFLSEPENVIVEMENGNSYGDIDDCETVELTYKNVSWGSMQPLSQECMVCGASFSSKLKLQKHVIEKHNIKIFECNICGAVRKDEEYLELHMNIHEGKTEYECRYCPKKFTRPTNTLRHMRKHWDKKEFQCEKCGERFSVDNMLYNHRLLHEAEENPIICNICNQTFKSRKTFNHHKMIHKNDRPRHQCPLCPKSFTERYTLKMHMITHGGVLKDTETHKTIQHLVSGGRTCVICGLKFKSKEILTLHLKDNHDVITFD